MSYEVVFRDPTHGRIAIEAETYVSDGDDIRFRSNRTDVALIPVDVVLLVRKV